MTPIISHIKKRIEALYQMKVNTGIDPNYLNGSIDELQSILTLIEKEGVEAVGIQDNGKLLPCAEGSSESWNNTVWTPINQVPVIILRK